MLFESVGRRDLMLLLRTRQLPLTLLLQLLPVLAGLFVQDSSLFPPHLESLFGARQQPFESVQWFRLEILGARRFQWPGKIAWLKIRQRLHHRRKTHSNRMV